MAKIIQLIGNSGAGKGNAIEGISSWIRERDYTVEHVVEPGALRELALAYHDREDKDILTEATIFTADRIITYTNKIIPRMKEERLIFLSDRGLPETVVYQGITGGLSIEQILRMNSIIPRADLYLCLLVDGEEGHRRILKRKMETNKPISKSETPEAISRLNTAYRDIDKYFKNVKYIDTTYLTEQQTLEKCIDEVRKIL